MKRVVKQGHESWVDLKGKTVRFDHYIPWDDSPWTVTMVLDHVETYCEDPRYPRYYIMDEDGGGYSFWEDEEVEVTILEDTN